MKIINDTYKGSVRYVVAQTEGVCSQAIELLVEGDVILDAAFWTSSPRVATLSGWYLTALE